MRLELLSGHRHLLPKIASLLHEEWGSLEPWASLADIEDRFVALIDTEAETFALVALSVENEFLGTAGVKLYEQGDYPEKPTRYD